MKTIIISILLAATYLSSYAQDQRLFENDWYLNKVTLEGVDYPAPHNSEIEFVTLVIDSQTGGFSISICYPVIAPESTITNTSIDVFEFIIIPDDSSCNLEENNQYVPIYNSFFFYDETYLYSYIIEEVDGHLKLTLENDEGNQAIYGDEPLGVPDLDVAEIALYPNPAKDILAIQSRVPIDQVVLYDILGKKLLSITQGFQQIDVSFLPKGVYFASITTAKGSMVRKVVKD